LRLPPAVKRSVGSFNGGVVIGFQRYHITEFPLELPFPPGTARTKRWRVVTMFQRDHITDFR
jgi:hypothetical protein